MDMQVDAGRIRAERERRVWSQEHLATLSGLGLRTIQRIEATNSASHESINAIASVFELPAMCLIKPINRQRRWLDHLNRYRVGSVLLLAWIGRIFLPPNIQYASWLIVGLWLSVECTLWISTRFFNQTQSKT